VTVDATALSGSYLFMDYATYEDAAPISVTLLPGQSHFFYTYGSSAVYFTVNADGTVDYDPALDGFMSGRGTGSLVAKRWAVLINPAELGAAWLSLDYMAIPTDKRSVLHLLPGQHFVVYDGKVAYFTLNADGTLTRDPALARFVIRASPIEEKYASLANAEQLLGAAIGGELTTPDGVGTYKLYQHGAIFHRPQQGAFAVYGAIYEKWMSLGGAQGYLGYPTTDTTPTADGRGLFNHFEGGSIWSSPTTGTHALSGDNLQKYLSL